MDDPGFIALMKEYYTVQVGKFKKIISSNNLIPNRNIRIFEWFQCNDYHYNGDHQYCVIK